MGIPRIRPDFARIVMDELSDIEADAENSLEDYCSKLEKLILDAGISEDETLQTNCDIVQRLRRLIQDKNALERIDENAVKECIASLADYVRLQVAVNNVSLYLGFAPADSHELDIYKGFAAFGLVPTFSRDARLNIPEGFAEGIERIAEDKIMSAAFPELPAALQRVYAVFQAERRAFESGEAPEYSARHEIKMRQKLEEARILFRLYRIINREDE